MTISKSYFSLVTDADSVSPENTLLLIGTALEGPARVPFRLKSIATPEDVLGDSPLYHAYMMAQEAGAQDIIVYRLNGQHASSVFSGMVYDEVQGLDVEQYVMKITAVGAGEAYEKIRVVSEGFTVTVYDASGHEQRVYDAREYPTLKELAKIMNLDAEYGIIQFEAEALFPDFPTDQLSVLNQIIHLGSFGGTKGNSEAHLINEREVYIPELKSRLLTALYSQLESDQTNYIINSELALIDFGVVSVTDLFQDDKIGLDEIVGQFCFKKSMELGQGCLGVIGTKPIQEPTVDIIKAKIDELILMKSKESTSGVVSTESSNVAVINYGEATWESHLQVVVGHSLRYSFDGVRLIPTPLSSSYAGLQASLPVEISTTNKQISGLDYLSYELDKEDVDKLLSNGYISIIRSVRKGFVPYAEITYMGKTKSALHSASSIRISHYVSRRLAQLLDNVIGTRVTPMSKREMMVSTERLVANILTSNMVKSYDIGFVTGGVGNLSVKINIIPHTEVKSISSLIRLPFAQGAM